MRRVLPRVCVLLAVISLATVVALPLSVSSAQPVLAADAALPSDPHGNVAFIPINTRSTSNGVTGVQIGSAMYAQSNPGTEGFQVLLISRQWTPSAPGGSLPTATVVSNTSYPVTNKNQFGTFQSALTNPATYTGCADEGCYLVISSLSNVIWNSEDSSAQQPGALFAQLGGSQAAGFTTSGYYSLIAPVIYNATGVNKTKDKLGLAGPGGGTEALSCVMTPATSGDANGSCTPSSSSAPIAQGAVTGALVQGDPTQPLAFTALQPQSIVSRQADKDANGNAINTVTVNGIRYPSDGTLAGNTGNPSGFQVVEIDRTTMDVNLNQTFAANFGNPVLGLQGMLTLLQTPQYQNEDALWVVSSIGAINSAAAGPGFAAVAQQLTTIGANFQVVSQLGQAPTVAGSRASACPSAADGNYTLIGWQVPASQTGALARAALESSDLVACETQGAAAQPVGLTALMALDARSLYTPQTSTAQGTPSGLQAAVLNGSTTTFPATNTSGAGNPPTADQVDAYEAVSLNISNGVLSPATDDIRAFYYGLVATTSSTPVENIVINLGKIDCAALAAQAAGGSAPFSEADCAGVTAQLTTEFTSLSSLNGVYSVLYTAFGNVLAGSGSALTSAKDAVSSSLGVGSSDGRSVAADVLSLFGTLAVDISSVVPGADVAGAAIDIVAQAASFGLSVADDVGGGGSAGSGVLTSTWNDLDDDLDTVFTNEQQALSNLVGLAVSDPNRLSAAGTAAAQFAANSTTSNPANLSDAMIRGTNFTFYSSLMATIYRVYTVYGKAGAPLSSATGFAEPYAQTLPAGTSLAQMVCQVSGSGADLCGAARIRQGSLFLQALGALPNPPAGSSATYAWGYQFMATAPDCYSRTLGYCVASSPSTAVLNTLFTTPDPSSAVLQLGVYPGYFYGRGSPLSIASLDDDCNMSTLNAPCSNGSVVGGSRPGRLHDKHEPRPPLTEREPGSGSAPTPAGGGTSVGGGSGSGAGSGAGSGVGSGVGAGSGSGGPGSGGGLAYTGAAVDPVPLLVVGLAAISLGAVLLGAGSLRRRRRYGA